MYETHFGFSSPPFQLNPDPAFYFNSKGHSRAMGYLQYGVMQGEGFIVITGEIGAGKTTLLRTLLEGLDRQKVLAAQIVSTQLESGELLQAIITAFGIPSQGSSKAHLIATLEAFLTALAAQGRHALLIVDEAQNLNERAVEELRMLSNFQLGNHALLQSFLVGQPELRRLLESPQMEQLRQRVIASQHLGPLGPEETQAYIEHRLRRVGWTDRPAFAPLAFDHVYAWTGGVPRRINRLANRLLLAAYLENAEVITPALVEQTAKELRTEIGESSYEPLPLPVRASVEVADAPAVVDVPPPSLPEVQAAAAEPAPVELLEPVASGATEEVLLERSEESPEPAEVSSAPAAEVGSDPVAPVAAPPPEQLATAAATDGEQGSVGGSGDMVPASDADAAEGDEQSPDAGPSVADVARALESLATPSEQPLQPVLRQERARSRVQRDVVLCVTESASGALKFAALAKSLSQGQGAVRTVLVNPGLAAKVWPWEQMDRLLPALEVGLHLGVSAATFEQLASPLFDRLGCVLDEFKPVAVVCEGDGDAVLACSLLARKRGVPLVRLGAGERGGGDGQAVNAILIEQLADLLVTRDSSPLPLTMLERQGIAAEKIFTVAGRLQVDALDAVWHEVTTPYGAFMRHAMPIYLGPTWSQHAGAGTPYAVTSLSLDPDRPEQVCERVALIVGLDALPKCIWLLDERSASALQARLFEDPALAERIHLVVGDGPRPAAERDLMDRTPVLCRRMASLCDQLSILRGATCAIVEPGQVLADAAELLDLPCVHVSDAVLLQAAELNGYVQDYAAIVSGTETRQDLNEPPGAAPAVAAHVRGWLARRRAVVQPDAPEPLPHAA